MRYLTQLALVTQLVYNPILLATRSYSRLLRPSMTWSFIGDSGRLLIISIGSNWSFIWVWSFINYLMMTPTGGLLGCGR